MNLIQNNGKCASCRKLKHQLRVRKSKLSGQKMFVCNECFDKKYEPRWLIIITGKDDKDAVAEFLIKRLYVGPEITAIDLLVDTPK